MNYEILLVIFLFVILPLLALLGLVFFIRSLSRKKNIGCGIAALLPLILVVVFFITIIYEATHIADSEVKARFENSTGLPFPPSGKIMEKRYHEAFNFLGDWDCAFMIEMDTLDYNKILQKIRGKDESMEYLRSLDLQIAAIFHTDTLEYEKIVEAYWKSKDIRSKQIFDTLVHRKILSEAEASRILEEGDEYTHFADNVESSFLLKKRFPAEDCAYSTWNLWFHKNKRIIVYEVIDY